MQPYGGPGGQLNGGFLGATMGVLVVEPHEICRMAIGHLIATSHLPLSIAAHAPDDDEAAVLASMLRPALILYGPAGPISAAAIERLRRASPGTRILVLSIDDDEETLLGAISAQPDGIIPKWVEPDVLREALERVARGQTVIHQSVATNAMAWAARPGEPEEVREREHGVDRLSRREREILDLLATGRSTQEIADALLLSRRTVETHILNAFRKLGVHERSDAVAAYRRG